MPADRHDLPSLDRLTADVASAMRAAEQHAAATRARRRAWFRRTPGGPLAALLVALVLAASALALLRATTGQGAEAPLPGPDAADRCDAAHVVAATVAAGTLVAGARCYRCAAPGAAAGTQSGRTTTAAALSRTAGRRAPMPSPRPCA